MKKRNASMDLLRIICMMMVVSMHYFGWGGEIGASNATTINFMVASGLSVFSRVSVDCFFMLSGFFISTLKEEAIFGKLRM